MRARHVLAAIVVALAYAGCFAAIRIGSPYIPPLEFAGSRALLAGLVLIACSGASRKGWLPPRRLLRWLPVLAGVVTAQYAAMFFSLESVTTGLASAFANSGPLFLVAMAVPVLGERLSRRSLAALAFGAVGVGLLAWSSGQGDGSRNAGALLPLLVAVAAATETVILKRIRVGSALLSLAGWQLVVGSLPLLILSAWMEPTPARWTPTSLGSLAFLALPGTALGLSLWYWLIQREPVARLAGFMFMVPVAGVILGWALFGEALSGRQVLGLTLALGGILVVSGTPSGHDRKGSG